MEDFFIQDAVVGLAGDRSQDVCPGGIGAGAEFSVREGGLSET
jgi:hypothetical protein